MGLIAAMIAEVLILIKKLSEIKVIQKACSLFHFKKERKPSSTIITNQ